MNPKRAPLDGLLIVDKPEGWTSHDVVARVRRLGGERQTGHAGTLDPLATGVLALGIGQGTRVLEYLSHAGKAYEATIALGTATDTYDRDGAVTATAPLDGVTRDEVERALASFRGDIVQRPPAYSAIKRAGQPLYRYARQGIAVEAPSRRVRVDSLCLNDFRPPALVLTIACGSGFYVRSLAHDLGQALGCGAHLSGLRRTRAGPFGLEDAWTLPSIERAAAAGTLPQLLVALDAPLRGERAVVLAGEHLTAISHGAALLLDGPLGTDVPCCRVYSDGGELIALATLDSDGTLRPRKVFPEGRRGCHVDDSFHPIALSSAG